MDPLPLSIRDPVRFRLDSIHNHVTKRLVKIFEDSATGKMTPDQAKACAPAVKIGLAIWERTAPIPRVIEDDAKRAVNIAIVLQSPEREPELSAGGLSIHLAGHNGISEVGNGRVRDAGRRQDLGSGGDHAGPRATPS